MERSDNMTEKTSIIISKIEELCSSHHVSVNKMLLESGLTKSVIDNMKKGSMPSVDKLQQIANYFGCSIDYLVGNGSSDDDLKFALFNGAEGITDEMFEEVKWFARAVMEREQAKKANIEKTEYPVRSAARNGVSPSAETMTQAEIDEIESMPDL